jgi:hypothetical protein
MKRQPKLHLIGQAPADIFADLDELRDELRTSGRRGRTTETFARVPHDKALALYRHGLSAAAWAILIELDRIILKGRGQNPVRFWSPRLRAVGIKCSVRARALRQLEATGVIIVRRKARGLSPWIFHTWYPKVQPNSDIRCHPPQ